MNLVTDFWLGGERYIVLTNYDNEGNEIYIAKIISTTRDSLRRKETGEE